MFMILNELYEIKNLEETYPGIKKVEDIDVYSSNTAPLLSTEEIISNLKDLHLPLL
jgi:hypothetical protein